MNQSEKPFSKAGEKIGIRNELKKEQVEIIEAILEGKDVLGILPTGFGKSACFTIPGLVNKDATLIVSPLLSLQADQVSELRKSGLLAFSINSESTQTDVTVAKVGLLRENQPRFLYVSPETFLSEKFYAKFGNIRFARIAVDEAHCISVWGEDFRLDYQRIKQGQARFEIPQVCAFTATVDSKIKADIVERLAIDGENSKVVEKEPHRDNLGLNILPFGKKPPGSESVYERKLNHLLFSQLVNPDYHGPSIIYCNSRNRAFEVYNALSSRKEWCKKNGFTVYLFHANIGVEDKKNALKGFKSDTRPIVVATSAFGMGINRSDVRQVIHFDTPRRLIEYAQQIGRAGRDGEKSLCTTYTDVYREEDPESSLVQRKITETPSLSFVERTYNQLQSFQERSKERDPVSAPNLRRFQKIVANKIQKSEQTAAAQERTLSMINSSIGILIKLGVLKDDPKGFELKNLEQGTPIYERLIEITKMKERAEERERIRVIKFFQGVKGVQDQDKLWELLKVEKVK